MKITVGCDPEIFLKTIGEGVPIAACGLFGGTKEVPQAIDDKGHALLEDNVAVEFNIAPAESMDAFRASIRMVMDEITKRMPEGLEFSTDSALLFPPEGLWHPAAMEFGCDPDFNAWTKEQNPRPCATDATLRSCGGHVHVGFSGLDPVMVIRSMDLHLGVPSLQLDKGELRRKLYGKAGSYRPKPYGAEYRTLSNFWIFKDELINWVYEQTQRAVDFIERGGEITKEMGDLIQSAINNGDPQSAAFVQKHYGV